MATGGSRALAIVDADVEHDDDEDIGYVGHEPRSLVGVCFPELTAPLRCKLRAFSTLLWLNILNIIWFGLISSDNCRPRRRSF